MKYELTPALRVGDLANWINVDHLELHSVSLTLDPQNPVLSMVLEHRPSGWKHVVTYTDSSAVEFWAVTMEKEFDAICEAVIQKMAADQKLPPGSSE